MDGTEPIGGPLTQDERAWLADIEELWAATTPGTWYPHHGDDASAMNACYVSVDIGASWSPRFPNWIIDDGWTMAAGFPEQANHEHVVAITLLQEPRLADPDECDQNTLFIADIHQQVPRLLEFIRRLDKALTSKGPV